MKKRNTVLLISITAILTSCAVVKKDYSLFEGDKGSGVVTLSYEYSTYERIQTDPEQARKEAIRRCKNWGYKGAEIFGKEEEERITKGFVETYRVTQEYQCTQ